MDASRFEVQQPKTMDIRQYLNARVGKMSYQSVNLDIEADVEPFEEPKRSHWKLYASIILMMAIGVVGYLLGKISKDDPAFQASMATSGKIAYSSLGPESKSYLFKQFVAKYGRKYTGITEESHRFALFLDTLQSVDDRNEAERSMGGSALHGITVYSDLSHAERKRMLGYKSLSTLEKQIYVVPPNDSNRTFADWSDRYVTDIKIQGHCGSCWAFSAIQQVETDAIRAGLLTRNETLSIQQVLACDEASEGCNGGTTEAAYQYIMKNGGVELEQDYPYSSMLGGNTTDSCISKRKKSKLTVTAYYGLIDETAMMDYVLTTGPISICVDASNWHFYTSGVLSSCGTTIDHCVQAVGIDTVNMVWKVRNSWREDWGDHGYLYLKAGANTCGLANDSTFVDVRGV